MYVILVYDIAVERVARVLKICRRYLTWVQNSVLEGEITEANLKKLRTELADTIDRGRDSVIVYTFRTTRYSAREIIGQERGDTGSFL